VVTAPADKCWLSGFDGRAVHGCGSRKYIVHGTLIDISAQKATPGGWPLELTLTEGGTIINQQLTSDDYGVVEVTEQTKGIGF
jgi:hypothetical protein